MIQEAQRIQALLQRLVAARRRLRRQESKVRYLQHKSCRTTRGYQPTTHGERDIHGAAETWETLAEERERLRRLRRGLAAAREQFDRWIGLLPDERWQVVLRVRYLQDGSMAQAAAAVEALTGKSCSSSHIYRLHTQALEAAAKTWPLG